MSASNNKYMWEKIILEVLVSVEMLFSSQKSQFNSDVLFICTMICVWTRIFGIKYVESWQHQVQFQIKKQNFFSKMKKIVCMLNINS